MSDLFGIEGAHVLITGGSSGLGRFFATFLAQRGARVTVAARRAEALAKTVDDISAANGQAQSVVMDVTNAASIETRAGHRRNTLRSLADCHQQCRRYGNTSGAATG